MRVLMVNTVPTDRNGITNVIGNLVRNIDGQDLQVDYLSVQTREASCLQPITDRGGKVYEFPRSTRGALGYIWKLSRLIRREKYHIVHAHGNSSTLALEMVAAWLGGCKVRIAHSHNTSCKFMTAHKLFKPLFHLLCTHRLACGTQAGQWLFGKRTFTVVNNGIDTRRFGYCQVAGNRIREELGLQAHQKVVGHVGLFNEVKNQTFLVDILEQLLRHSSAYVLLLVGEGSLRQQIQQKVARLGLSEKVIFTGATDRVAEFLSACDLIVMPSLHEGLPVTLIEEQANGLQCIVSDTITREVDKTGNLMFVPLTADAKHWAQKVHTLPLPEDRQLASQMAIEKIKACGYDSHSEAEKLKQYYCNTIRG